VSDSESDRVDVAEQPELETPANPTYGGHPHLFVLSGPSGAGKDSIVDGLVYLGVDFYRVVTAVTREPRPHEVHGTHHYFLTPEEFARWDAEGNFLETAIVYGNRYGTPLHEVSAAIDRGQDVILRVDVQGAATVRKRMPESIHIFIGVPGLSLETLQARRDRRGSEVSNDRELRDSVLRDELAAIPEFDYYVVNEDGHIDRAIDQVRAILVAEKCRISLRK
jgi:guanylate kinase